MSIPDKSLLEHFEPIAKLSGCRKQEVADVSFIEAVDKGVDPLRMNVTKAAQLVYLVKGDLGLRFENSSKLTLRAGSPAAKHPINSGQGIKDTVALTDIEVLRIDTDLLDIMMTWDQLSSLTSLAPAEKRQAAMESRHKKPKDWVRETRVFSVEKLHNGVFSRLPVSNIEEMFRRMTMVEAAAGQMIIQQGTEGDYYYLIESGSVQVTKMADMHEGPVVLAELKEGDAFGEEALASDNKRNATVTMKTDGQLLRLNKADFVTLLKEALITRINRAEAEAKVAAGAIWADVRLPSEYNFDHLAGAISLPLSEIRQLAAGLDPDKTYVLYCQTGRRSAAAAFILAQRGFDVLVLAGGMRRVVL